MVLMTQPPQPRSKLLAMTRALVPGGPDASTNGFSNRIPFTSMLRSTSAMEDPFSLGETGCLAHRESVCAGVALGRQCGGARTLGQVEEIALRWAGDVFVFVEVDARDDGAHGLWRGSVGGTLVEQEARVRMIDVELRHPVGAGGFHAARDGLSRHRLAEAVVDGLAIAIEPNGRATNHRLPAHGGAPVLGVLVIVEQAVNLAVLHQTRRRLAVVAHRANFVLHLVEGGDAEAAVAIAREGAGMT